MRDVIKEIGSVREKIRRGAQKHGTYSVTESKWAGYVRAAPNSRQLKFPLTCVTFPSPWQPRPTAEPQTPGDNILRRCARRPNGSRYPGDFGATSRSGAGATTSHYCEAV